VNQALSYKVVLILLAVFEEHDPNNHGGVNSIPKRHYLWPKHVVLVVTHTDRLLGLLCESVDEKMTEYKQNSNFLHEIGYPVDREP
jgi:hypothetical protein